MNHLHVISSLNPEGGGPAEGVRQLCHAVTRLGYQVEIATTDGTGSPWATDLCCPVHQLGPGRFGNYRYSPRLEGWLERNASRFDAVIVNGLWQHHGFATWNVLRNRQTPYFVFSHGMLDPWFKHQYPLKHMKKWLYWPWAEYRVLRDARAVLFTCEEEKRLARRSFGLYRVNEIVVNHGTPGPDGDATAQREVFLSRLPHLRNKRLVLFIGRIHPKKGCDLLLDAFAQVAMKDPDLHLVMAGPMSGEFQRVLVRQADRLGIASRVTWTGMLAGDLKWGAFHAAEVFALPSHQENFGIAVAEALACGLPVLISDKVNIWREVAEDNAGLIAPDTVAGASKLLQGWLALSAFERARMARNAQASFRKRFHIEAAARSLLNAMETGIAEAGERSVA